MARNISLLCSLGDVTVSWQASDDALVLPVIQQMIDRGVRFFLLKKSKHVPLEQVSQAADARKLVIPDASLAALLASGALTLGELLTAEPTGEVATNATDVAANDTVAVQEIAGG